MFFITIHNEQGNRIDDESDYPLNETQLNNLLADYEEIKIPGTMGQRFWKNEKHIISYQNMPD